MTYALFLLGFAALLKGADLLVNGAASVARRLCVSDLVIGMTVVAFGTSTPEFFVSVIAGLRGNGDLAITNVVGSNIANILLILGAAALIRPLHLSHGMVWREMPFGLLASIALVLLAGDAFIDGAAAGVIGRADGLVLLCFFAVFLYYSGAVALQVRGAQAYCPTDSGSLPRALLLVAAGLVGLVLGARWIVDGAAAIARALGVSEGAVGLTIVAVGTSLPELATSVVAARRGNSEIAIGNIVGSNIFNILFILGVAATARPLEVRAERAADLAMMIASNLMLFATVFFGRRHVLGRWEGGILLAGYLAYAGLALTGAR